MHKIMNRTSRSLIHVAVAVLLMAALSAVVYYAGIHFAKTFLGGNPPLSEWERHYRSLVALMGAVASLVLLLWVIASHWLLHVSWPIGVGRRSLWAVLWVLLAVLCCAVPFVKSSMDAMLKLAPVIYAIFILGYAVFGYWLGSIFVTSDRFKYTPLWSEKLR